MSFAITIYFLKCTCQANDYSFPFQLISMINWYFRNPKSPRSNPPPPPLPNPQKTKIFFPSSPTSSLLTIETQLTRVNSLDLRDLTR